MVRSSFAAAHCALPLLRLEFRPAFAAWLATDPFLPVKHRQTALQVDADHREEKHRRAHQEQGGAHRQVGQALCDVPEGALPEAIAKNHPTWIERFQQNLSILSLEKSR